MPSITRRWPGNEALIRAAMWSVVAIAFTNALLYVLAVGRPTVWSDNWIFIDPFLRDAIAGNLDLGNFLVKRAGIDHAQPLNKLSMLLNYRVFGLDFRYEGVAAMLFGLAGLMVLYRLQRADAPRHGRPLAFYLLFAAIAGVFFSLNSAFIYAYSMVTMWYSLYLFVFLMTLAAWHALAHDRMWPLALVTLVYGIVGDDSAILLVVALAIASGVNGGRTHSLRTTVRAILVMAVVLALSRVVYTVWGETSGTTQAVFNQPLPDRIGGLASQWRDAWLWLAIPAASGIAAITPLKNIVGEHWQVARDLLAVAILGAHVAFWWATLRVRPGAAWFASLTLMLLFYGHVAGILLVRVFTKGANYLDQPRYVSFYQLGIIALLMMGVAWVLDRPAGAARHWLAAAAGALLLVQVPLTGNSIRQKPYIMLEHQRHAASIAALARDPVNLTADCKDVICRQPVERRIAAMRLLKENRLNLFSPEFLRRYPGIAAAAGLPEGRD